MAEAEGLDRTRRECAREDAMSVTMEVANQLKSVMPRRAVLEMPEYHPPLAGREALRLDFNEEHLLSLRRE